jgi:flagellar assembly protein FliH
MTAKSGLTAWERWELASFDPPPVETVPDPVPEPAPEIAGAVPPASTLVTDEELAALRAEARNEGLAEGHAEGTSKGYDEGFAKGYAEGIAKADELGREQAQKLATVTSALETQIAALDASVADELLALAIEIARKVIYRVQEVRPEALIEVIHAALAQMPVQHAAIHLHPDDASLARLYAGEQLAHAGHRIHENSKLARGDVVIDCGGSHIDATMAQRWQRVIDSLGMPTPWLNTEPAHGQTSLELDAPAPVNVE